MAITNKLITFNKLTSFETQLAQGNILETSIVFIKDAKKIWTKGTYFDCSGGGASNIAVYETNEVFWEDGSILTQNQDLSTILFNHDISTIVLKEVEGSDPDQLLHCLVFNLVEQKIASINKRFVANGSGCYFEFITNYTTDLTIHRYDLALKSDIPNTDDFATQANLTSAVTQLTTNIAKKQDKLVSGTNIATINSNSILGSGNFDLATTDQLRAKQDTLVSGTNIKTINSTSLLGSGNIAIKDTKNLTYILNNSTSGTVTLQPNACIYMPNPLTGKLAINACSTISSNNADLIESRICFRMPNKASLPVIQFNGVAIRWAGGNAPTFEADFTYEVSLFYPSNANNVGPMGVCVGFK